MPTDVAKRGRSLRPSSPRNLTTFSTPAPAALPRLDQLTTAAAAHHPSARASPCRPASLEATPSPCAPTASLTSTLLDAISVHSNDNSTTIPDRYPASRLCSCATAAEPTPRVRGSTTTTVDVFSTREHGGGNGDGTTRERHGRQSAETSVRLLPQTKGEVRRRGALRTLQESGHPLRIPPTAEEEGSQRTAKRAGPACPSQDR